MLSLLERSFLKIFVGFPPNFAHGILVSQNLKMSSDDSVIHPHSDLLINYLRLSLRDGGWHHPHTNKSGILPAHSNPVNKSSIFYSIRCPPLPSSPLFQQQNTSNNVISRSFYPIVLRRIRGGWIFREGGTGGFVEQILEKSQFLVFDTVLGFARIAVAFHAMNFHSTKRSRCGVTSVMEIT